MAATDEPRSSRVQSVDRAAVLLRAVAMAAHGEGSAARLARQCGLNRATAWRILSTLEGHGMVRQDPATGHWFIGLGLVEIARAADADAVAREARLTLEKLSAQSGETAAVALLRGPNLTYVDEVVPDAVVAATWQDRSVPLHATSTGKVLLAFGSVGTDLTDPLPSFTDTTVTDPEVLATELSEVRRRGYATCRGEFEPTAWGVSAPVRDRIGSLVAVLSIWGPADRVTPARLPGLGDLVAAAARGLGSR